MALDNITHVAGTGIHVPGHDIDTDRIIPARFMKCVTFDGLGDFAFHDARFHEDGAKKDHPLNDDRFNEASILLSGANFGCGSSREHAPQALYRCGIRAIIAESFADIFFGNCTTLGVPCLVASREDIHALAEIIDENPGSEIIIDVANGRVTCDTPDGEEAIINVHVPHSAKTALVEGRWDPISELLEGADAVAGTAGKLPYMAS
jgi:3-isopropylmalate/(R)-2-methylmalate dehydratase small subunit